MTASSRRTAANAPPTLRRRSRAAPAASPAASGLPGAAVADALSALGRRTAEPPISWLMNLTLSQPDLISLAAGFTDNDTLPVEETRELLAELLRSPASGRPALQYGSTPGLPELRRLTAERLVSLDGPAARTDAIARPENILVTSGSQQLLYLILEALCDPGDIVLVEDPTYFVFLGILQSLGVRARGVPLAEDGLDTRALDQLLSQLKRAGELPRVKALYLVSYFQNPTGTTTSRTTKAEALELLHHYAPAAGHRLYLIEDAAYRELRFAGEDVPSALATRYGQHVIYAGTYSKPFATGVRIGFGCLPPELRAVVTRLKGNHDFGSTNLLQHLLARALASGRYDEHLPMLRRRYATKAATMVEALRRHFPPAVHWRAPAGGLYVWARCPRSVRTGRRTALFRAALAQKVLYVPGELCYAGDPTRPAPNCEMRLSFGGAVMDDIREGIRRLGEVLEQRGVDND